MSVGKVGLDLARKILTQRVSSGGFDRLLNKVQITEAGGGSLTAEMKVDLEHCAPNKGFMHGAMATLLVDSLSGVAMMTTNPNFQHGGVSLNINMTYLKAAKVGDDILIKASTDKVGSKIAFLSVDIFSKSTSELLVKGSHVKFIENAISPKDKR